MSGRKFFLYQFPAIFYALLIFTISSIPYFHPPNLHIPLQDKIFHFLEYSVFAFLLSRAFSNASNIFFKKNSWWLTLAMGILYAIGDESYQKTVLGRSSEFYDFVADSLGVMLSLLAIKSFQKFRASKVRSDI
jgi:VanZ family protein